MLVRQPGGVVVRAADRKSRHQYACQRYQPGIRYQAGLMVAKGQGPLGL